MHKRFWSICIVTCAVLLSSSTLVSAEPRNLEQDTLGQSNLSLRSLRGARAAEPVPVVPSSIAEPGDDDAPNKDGDVSTRPALDSGSGKNRLWDLGSLRTGIRLHLLKYFFAIR